MQKVTPCLWFDDQAEEAARFYTSIFNNSNMGKIVFYGDSAAEASGQKKGTVMTVDFQIDGFDVLALNGGPIFKFTPALSFFVWCYTEKEIDNLWKNLSQGGTARFQMGQYPWSEKYGWVTDKYGVEWQLVLDEQQLHKKKIAPSFLFVDKLFGKGEEAMNFYMSLFKDSKVHFMAKDEATKTVQHAMFTLDDQPFILMEGKGEYSYTFTSAFSLMVNCDNQQEIDEYWSKLSVSGSTEQCGWLKDKFGVSWQIVPRVLEKLVSDPDPIKAENVMKTMLGMKKLDIRGLEQASL